MLAKDAEIKAVDEAERTHEVRARVWFRARVRFRARVSVRFS